MLYINKASVSTDFFFNFRSNIWVILKELTGIFFTLTDTLVTITVPATRFINNVALESL